MNTAPSSATRSSLLAQSDARGAVFLDALIERSMRVVGHSGRPVVVHHRRTDYVIPGVLLMLSDAAHCNRLWVGINEHRLFYIQRFSIEASQAQIILKFCFGGATKVGWAFNFEPMADGVSVWGTAETSISHCEHTGETIRRESGDVVDCFRLTPAGAFWVNDVALMLQSSFRTAQRSGVLDASEEPAPM